MLRVAGSLGDHIRWWTLAFVASAAGCTAVPIPEPGNSSDSGPTPEPDSAAIGSVGEAAYVELGHPQETYDAGLARICSQDCLGFWANVGTCGPWLFISESHGYGGTNSYYDPQTGLVVAVEQFTDVAEPYVFPVDCEPEITETIPCFRESDPEL